MMPLAETGLIGGGVTLLTALVAGFAFGWLLERAGLAHAPKLAGQFYFTDLTVLKVLFTALITAMAGVHALDWLGVLDLGLVHMPETFVVPQAVGGALFGAGFLLGGLCPGTSCVAAASGRLDGLGVLGGILVGVLAFNVSADWIAPFSNSTPMGQVTVTQAIAAWRNGVQPRSIAATDLAERIMRRDATLRVFDLNSPVDFERFHIAGATHTTLRAVEREALPADSIVVLYANNLAHATRAWHAVNGRVADAFVLRGGIQEWFVRVYEPRLAVDATPVERVEFERAERLSRFFGGQPQRDVTREQLLAAAVVRRRGC